MEKIALITDSASDVPSDLIKEYDIKVLPFRIIYKDREYIDGVDITPEQVYENMVNEVPTTSLPSMDDMEKLFQKLENEGYDKAIAVTLSSGLSGIYNAVKIAADNHPGIETFIWDSKSISVGEAVVVLECGKLIKKGKSFQEIKDYIPTILQKSNLFFVVGTLEYLKKGGRIGKVAGTIAELLDIKPIISPDKNDGKYFTYAKIRGRKKSLNKLLEIAEEVTRVKKCRAFLMHGNSLSEALEFANRLKVLPNVLSVYFGGNISPVAGVHSGPGLVGLCLLEE
ncbi:MAG: DegV family protein [Bacillota bacterium]|nr:DegV family protein [Bacillota bacterium]